VLQWSGGRVGEGTEQVISELPLTRYEVKQVAGRLIQAAPGVFEYGDLRVGPITPKFAGGGFSRDELDPARNFGVGEDRQKAVVYRLSGDVDGDHTLVDIDTTDATGWFMTIRRTRRSPR